MQTTHKIINALQSLLNTMFKQAKEYNQDCMLTSNMLTDFEKLTKEDPVLYPFNLNEAPSEQDITDFFKRVEEHATKSVTMPYLPISYFKDSIQGRDVFTPAFLPWQIKNNREKNFIINYDKATEKQAFELYKHIVMSILLSLPAKSVHLSFVNTQLSDWTNFFTASDALDKTIYDKISSKSEYNQLIEHLRKRTQEYRHGEALEDINNNARKIEDPYEIVVLLDDPDSEISYQEELIPLFTKGSTYGIYFIGLNDTEKVAKYKDQDNILKHTDCFYSINAGEVNSWEQSQKNGLITTTSIANNNHWSKAAFDFLKNITNRKIVHTFDWKTAIESPYTQTDNEIIAPIGFTEDGKPFNFQMDVNKGHYHAFVIGATGSGKSRFLHDIILSMTAKYQPEDIELYLLDFKGVEFNCYREFKHTRAILVDRADEQITYEVIKDIKLKMEERQQQLRATGASDVAEFNKMNTGTHFTQIILVADECQTLFADRAKNGRLQNEMVDIIALIAQQGRAYGVHLLLSTQSLANAPQLGKEILNQIGEHYILPCLPADAARLVSNEKQTQTEKGVATMERGKGQCYYEGADGATLFTFNFVQKGEMQGDLVFQLEQKAASHNSNGQAYFSGALQFPISQEVADYIATKGRNNIVASPGQIISLEQTPLTISLKDGLSENIALFGINDRQFVTRTTIGLMTSLMISNKQKDLGYHFIVFDCLDDEEAEYPDVLDELKKNDLCEVANTPRERADKLKQLCDAIASNHATPTVLVIIGQECFRELKLNQPIGDATAQTMNEFEAALAAMDRIGKTASSTGLTGSSVNTVQKAMEYILSEGPANGVHTILQVDKPNHFLFPQDDSLRKNDFYAKCKHVILLRSESTALTALWLQEDISRAISQFEDNPSRLRAYYYNEGSDKYQLFTPFVLPDKNTINNIIK